MVGIIIFGAGYSEFTQSFDSVFDSSKNAKSTYWTVFEHRMHLKGTLSKCRSIYISLELHPVSSCPLCSSAHFQGFQGPTQETIHPNPPFSGQAAFREIAGVIGFTQKIPIIPAVPRLMCDLPGRRASHQISTYCLQEWASRNDMQWLYRLGTHLLLSSSQLLVYSCLDYFDIPRRIHDQRLCSSDESVCHINGSGCNWEEEAWRSLVQGEIIPGSSWTKKTDSCLRFRS